MNKETIIQSIIYMLEQMTENEVRDFYHKNFIKKEKFKILKIFEECMYCKKIITSANTITLPILDVVINSNIGLAIPINVAPAMVPKRLPTPPSTTTIKESMI